MAARPPSFRFEQDDFKAIAECLQINFDAEDGDLASHGASFSLDRQLRHLRCPTLTPVLPQRDRTLVG